MNDVTDPLRHYDPRVFRTVGRFLQAFTKKYFRFRISGYEHIPEGPCLIVGNHSGLGVADVMCLVGSWYERFGETRRATGMMADGFVKVPLTGNLYRAFGAVSASQRAARAAFAAGHDVVVFPGGELDACRPLTQPREVVFGPRRGYVRLALEQGVPIVPLATIGSHWSIPMLPGGYTVSRLLKTKTWCRNERFPLPAQAFVLAAGILGGAAGLVPSWLAASAILAGLVPWPVRITSRFLPAIDIACETASITDEDERVEAAHEIVHGALQDAVRDLSHGARYVRTSPDHSIPQAIERPAEHEHVPGELFWSTRAQGSSERPSASL